MTTTTRTLPALSVLALAAALAAGCGDPIGPRPPALITDLPRALSAAEQRVIEGSNVFAFDLLRELVADAETTNTFMSPLSASMAFGMAMNGAAGETWTQMRDALGFDGMDEQEINEAYRALIAMLLDLDPKVQFGIGNSVWTDDGFVFLPDYLDRLATSFHAQARSLPFGDPATLDVINGWVSDVTLGRIDRLLDEIPTGIVAYLINAVYFNGDWRHRFDADHTAPAPFTREDGSTAEVAMMAGHVGHRVLFGTGGAHVVELPYGGDAFAAVAVLPPAGQTLRELVVELDESVWARWMADLDALAADAREDGGTDMEGLLVRLPKLEMDWRGDLIGPLARLGMVDAFDPNDADFSRMTGGRDLHIGEAFQKTFLKVDEEGTEAAAATAIGMRVVSAPPSITFDRPYLFAIRERLSGTILFIGAIGDPGA